MCTMFKPFYLALFAAALAAAIAIPVENDVETSDEFITNAIASAATKFSAFLKGKECLLRKCPGCETKTRRSFGRRMLSSEKFGWKSSTYQDCTEQNKCQAENVACEGKISALKATVTALESEIAQAEQVASTHQANAADKEHEAELKREAAEAAKVALANHQKHIANLAQALASELKAQQNTRNEMDRAVLGTAKAIKDAKERHAEKAQQLADWNAKQAAPAKAEADAAKDVKDAENAHQVQLAEAKDANDQMDARVAAARAALKEAEGNLQGFSDRHQAAQKALAGSESEAAQAKALADLKQATVDAHEARLKEVNKRIEMNLQTSERFGTLSNAVGSAATKLSAYLKGKECLLRKCGDCEKKTKRAWGRRMLSADDAAGLFKSTTYTDCSVRNACLAENAGCTAKIAALDGTAKALESEIATAKALADEHGASVADKEKLAQIKAAAAKIALKALEDHQAKVANLASALSSEKKQMSDVISSMESAVRKAAANRKEAFEEHEDAKKELAKAAAAESKSAQEKANAESAEQEQLAEAQKEKAEHSALVEAAKKALAEAQAALKSFADQHQDATSAAAESKTALAAAKALHDLKLESVHSLEKQKSAVASKISW